MKSVILKVLMPRAFDWSDQALQAHRKYLQETARQSRFGSADLVAIREDHERHADGTIANIIWNPVLGEMNAIRQYITEHASYGVLYAAANKNGVEGMHYDLTALGIPPDQISIMEDACTDNNSPIVLTTHQALVTPRSGHRLAFQHQRHCIIDEGMQLYMPFLSVIQRKIDAVPDDIDDGLREHLAAQFAHELTGSIDQIGNKIKEYQFPYVFVIGGWMFGKSKLFSVYQDYE